MKIPIYRFYVPNDEMTKKEVIILYILHYLVGWTDLLEGLVTILSFGSLRGNFTFPLIAHTTIYHMNCVKRYREERKV